MTRLISLFTSIQHDPQLSKPASGNPPGTPPPPDYAQDPEYFQHLLAYLRQQRELESACTDEQFEEPLVLIA